MDEEESKTGKDDEEIEKLFSSLEKEISVLTGKALQREQRRTAKTPEEAKEPEDKKESTETDKTKTHGKKPSAQTLQDEKKLARKKTVANVSGGSLEECLVNGMAQLGLKKDEIEYKVMQEGSNVLFGSKKPFRVIVYDKRAKEMRDREREILSTEALNVIGDAVSVLQDMDGYFRYENFEDGLYLVIYPPVGNGKQVDDDAIRKHVKDRKLDGIDMAKLEEAIGQKSGEPVRIGEHQRDPEYDGVVEIDFNEDKTEARINIIPHKIGGISITYDDVVRRLEVEGIVGFDTDRIEKMYENMEFNKWVVIAKGKPAVSGRDSYLDYAFEMGISGAFVSDEDADRVDFKNVGSVRNVVAGQLIAVVVVPIAGEPGNDVFGNEIPAKQGTPYKIVAGKNMLVDSDYSKFYSKISGQVVWSKSRVSVEYLYEVQGDVGLNVGNIEFMGSVSIGGSVQDGFNIKAAGNIDIKGSVGNCKIESDANILIMGGILGKEQAVIKAKGDIIVKFVENATLNANGNIFIAETVMHSNINAAGSVVMTGKKATIVGGKVCAGIEINAKVIGSVNSTPTELEAGVSYILRSRLQEIEKEYTELNGKLDEIKKNIQTVETIKKRTGEIPKEREEFLVSNMKERREIITRISELQSEMETLNGQIMTKDTGKISAMEVVYSGARITIKNAFLAVKDSYKYVTFVYEGGNIKTVSYQRPKTMLKEVLDDDDVRDSGTEMVSENQPRCVVIDAEDVYSALARGAHLLGIKPEEADYEILETSGIHEKEKKPSGIIKVRIFKKGTKETWADVRMSEEEMEALRAASSLDAYLNIKNVPEGILMTVFPPVSGKEEMTVDEEKVKKIIEERKLTGIDFALVSKTIEERNGLPVKIGEWNHFPENDGKALIEISKDKMKAFMTIIPAGDGGKPLGFESAMNAVIAGGVREGVNEETVRNLLERETFNEPVVVAEGQQEKDGEDGKIEYKCKVEKDAVMLKEDEFGRVDYKEMGLIENVVPGQVLAVITPATSGEEGMYVTGEKIKPKPGKSVKPPAGRNTSVSKNGREITSAIEGRVILLKGKLNVEPIYEIKGNVDYSTGNVDFVGTVIVSGNIEDGFSVKASGDIDIKGNVGKSLVQAGGNIFIKMGVLGKDSAALKAEKSVYAKFAENAKIEANEDIVIPEVILHSELNARNKIMANGKKGLIIGGLLRAGDEVIAKTIGSKVEVPTVIEVGVEPEVRNLLSIYENELHEKTVQMDKIGVGIRTLTEKKKKKPLSPDAEERLEKLIEVQGILKDRTAFLKTEISVLKERVEMGTKGKVSAIAEVNPGVKIVIRNVSFTVKDVYRYSTFYYSGGEIKIGPYSGKKK